MKKITLLLIFSLITFTSCEKEEFSDSPIKDNITAKKKTEALKNGILHFSSKKDLEHKIESYRENDELLNNRLTELYLSGFQSFKPILDEDNKQLKQYYSKKKSKTKDEDIENNVIADPFLAALVNERKEIIVGDSIYKFTDSKGVFSSKVIDSTYLINYVNNLDTEYKNMELEPCSLRMEQGGYTQMDEKITRYIEPIQDCGGGGGGGYTPTPTPPAPELQDIIDDLPICDGNAGGNWIQGIFGKSYVCRSYFEDRRRVKIEFWDQSYGFYKSVGIQVKNQTKTFGVWWASKADEIHLGINRVYLKYDYPQPKINSYNPAGFANPFAFKAPIYMYNGKFQIHTGIGYGENHTYGEIALEVTRTAMPYFRLDDEPILNIYIPNLPVIDEYELNLSTADILSESNFRAAYKMGIDFLKKHFGEQRAQEEVFAVTYQKNYDEIETLYFGERYSDTDENKLVRRLYKDNGFLIGGGWSDSGGAGGSTSFTLEPVTDFYRDYTKYEIDFYGAARRGSRWRGNRMIRE